MSTYSNKEQGRERAATKRFTFDTVPEQHLFMKRFCLENGVPASAVMRALMFRLEIDENLANTIIDDIEAD